LGALVSVLSIFVIDPTPLSNLDLSGRLKLVVYKWKNII